MIRRNRLQLRLSLILILIAAVIGAWYAGTHWQIAPEQLQFSGLNEDSSWIDVFAALGEQAIQLFMGLTS
ncbi:MAG: hypothetical protein KDD92_18745 [Caldilineaceae bacterium]|nr:hypothetical protein [Caldilineaceae bacterium]